VPFPGHEPGEPGACPTRDARGCRTRRRRAPPRRASRAARGDQRGCRCASPAIPVPGPFLRPWRIERQACCEEGAVVVGELEAVVLLDAGELGTGQARSDFMLACPRQPASGLLATRTASLLVTPGRIAPHRCRRLLITGVRGQLQLKDQARLTRPCKHQIASACVPSQPSCRTEPGKRHVPETPTRSSVSFILSIPKVRFTNAGHGFRRCNGRVARLRPGQQAVRAPQRDARRRPRAPTVARDTSTAVGDADANGRSQECVADAVHCVPPWKGSKALR
jgi:hypothetical protein